ncbi:nickel-binding protein [Actinomadura sp. 6N118]|uniref:nickel-binding protein n=1 Tax=Actinomadura sp. 6N118 TaxID=3375151 RepID=UPI003787FB2D
MSKFMDVHHGMKGVTADQLRQGKRAAAPFEGELGVHFEHTWADPKEGVVYCLTDAPSADAVRRFHEHAGAQPDEIHVSISM